MQYIILYFIFLFFTFTFAVTNCTYDNDCANDIGNPYCIHNTCRQCNPDSRHHITECMCPLQYYCISNPEDENYGYCREKESNIIGRNCDASLTDPYSLVQGVNDTVYCGKVVFNSELLPVFAEWQGICVKGICLECASPPIPALPLIVCNDGRTCKNNMMALTPVGILSMNYVLELPLSLGTFLLLLEIVIGIIAGLLGVYGLTFYKLKAHRNNINKFLEYDSIE